VEANLRELAGLTSGQLPTKMARINSVLDALPDELTEYMLCDFMNKVFV
jgi:hypothetical protein